MLTESTLSRGALRNGWFEQRFLLGDEALPDSFVLRFVALILHVPHSAAEFDHFFNVGQDSFVAFAEEPSGRGIAIPQGAEGIDEFVGVLWFGPVVRLPEVFGRLGQVEDLGGDVDVAQHR